MEERDPREKMCNEERGKGIWVKVRAEGREFKVKKVWGKGIWREESVEVGIRREEDVE